jgi:hypothetical protein
MNRIFTLGHVCTFDRAESCCECGSHCASLRAGRTGGGSSGTPGDRRVASGCQPPQRGQAMASATMIQDGRPPPAEVRAQVQRMTASDVFATSPQLSAFLMFVVEAVLRGQGERLKGYTDRRRGAAARQHVRPADRSDRARRGDAAAPRDRALLRRRGGEDSIVIDLPRGGYVPRFSWRAHAAEAPARRRLRSCLRRAMACRPCASRPSWSSARPIRARSQPRRSAGRSPTRSHCSTSSTSRSRRRPMRARRAPRAPPAAPTTGSTVRWSIAATGSSTCASS